MFMHNMSNKRFLLLPLLLALLNCTPNIPDVAVFENLDEFLGRDPETGDLMLQPSPACMTQIKEASCGHGVYVLSKKEFYVGEITLWNKKKWSQIKAESIYVPAVESYAPLETYIINSCKKMGCNAEVDKFKVGFKSLTGVSGAIKNP